MITFPYHLQPFCIPVIYIWNLSQFPEILGSWVHEMVSWDEVYAIALPSFQKEKTVYDFLSFEVNFRWRFDHKYWWQYFKYFICLLSYTRIYSWVSTSIYKNWVQPAHHHLLYDSIFLYIINKCLVLFIEFS